jgi:hypothetical protein
MESVVEIEFEKKAERHELRSAYLHCRHAAFALCPRAFDLGHKKRSASDGVDEHRGRSAACRCGRELAPCIKSKFVHPLSKTLLPAMT